MSEAWTTRIEPVDLARLDAVQAQTVASLPDGHGDVRAPFLVMLHNPSLMGLAYPEALRLRYGSLLTDDVRELATLVAAKVWEQGFEWAVHAGLALEAGLSQATVDAIAAGQRPTDLSAEDMAVYEFCIQLHTTKQVDNDCYARTKQRLGVDGLLELTWLSGFYATLAMVMNVARLQPSWDAALRGEPAE